MLLIAMNRKKIIASKAKLSPRDSLLPRLHSRTKIVRTHKKPKFWKTLKPRVPRKFYLSKVLP